MLGTELKGYFFFPVDLRYILAQTKEKANKSDFYSSFTLQTELDSFPFYIRPPCIQNKMSDSHSMLPPVENDLVAMFKSDSHVLETSLVFK